MNKAADIGTALAAAALGAMFVLALLPNEFVRSAALPVMLVLWTGCGLFFANEYRLINERYK